MATPEPASAFSPPAPALLGWSRSRAAGAGALAAVLLVLVLLGTAWSIAIVWDEGYTLGREERVRQWIEALGDPAGFAATWDPPTPLERLIQADRERPPRPDQIDSRSELLRAPGVTWFWPFAREEPHGHPPFYAIVGLAGDWLAPASWPPLPRARLGPILLFSLAGGVAVGFVARRYGAWASVATLSAWGLSPRLFAHAHYAHYDAILTSLWVLAVIAFWQAISGRRAWPGAMGFGLALGAAAATKLTGWFILLPMLAWVVLLGRDRRTLTVLALAAPVAALVLWLLVPPWWTAPIAGVESFLRSNLTRGQTTRIPTLFLGHVYVTPRASLPWYNTLVLTVMTTPVLLLGLLAGGIVAALRWARTDRFGPLVLLNWVFVMTLRALPNAPGHDGVRQFLPAFGLAALLAGVGAAEALRRWPRLGRVLVGAALIEAAASVALMMPVPDSYYSPLVGGLPGAARLGMEPTYYWDALTPEARRWLAAHTPPGGSVLFATNPTSWLYLRQTGELSVAVAGVEPDAGPPAWYVVQNRPGLFSPIDEALVAALGPRSVIVSKHGVPLLWAFPFEAYARARSGVPMAAGARPNPEIGS